MARPGKSLRGMSRHGWHGRRGWSRRCGSGRVLAWRIRAGKAGLACLAKVRHGRSWQEGRGQSGQAWHVAAWHVMAGQIMAGAEVHRLVATVRRYSDLPSSRFGKGFEMAKVKMATTPAVEETNGSGYGQIKLAPIKKQTVKLRIIGTSPLIQHQWGQKALDMMRSKHAGKKTKTRDVRDPEAEGREAMYVTQDGRPGVPAMAIKSAIISAAHKDIGIEKTLVKKSLFIRCDDAKKVIPMECSAPVITEDTVRVGQGSADLRYRPYFHEWAVNMEFEIDAELLRLEDLCNLIDRAGFGVGIGEWRPEKGGEYGRFEVDRTTAVKG